MMRTVIAGFAIALMAGVGLSSLAGVSLATAQDANVPQVDRHTMMEQVGATARVLSGMARGEAEYDANTAVTGMRLMRAVAASYPYLFPEGSQSGFDSRAAETIWSDNAGFVAAVQKFEDDAATGVEASALGLQDFQAAFGVVGQNCQACHETYRTARN